MDEAFEALKKLVKDFEDSFMGDDWIFFREELHALREKYPELREK